MVGSISSSSFDIMAQQSATSTSTSSLTESQLETISSVLSEYDTDNLSASDAESIVASFEAAGIEGSKELASAMSAEGFDAQEVGELAGVQGGPGGAGGMPPPPPPPSEEEETAISSLLDTLLSSEDDEDSDTESSLTADSTFDEVMEYTSRILSLNESSKTEVMDMLENISENSEDYTDEEKSNIIKNSLSSILGDNNNYNHTSFYA